MYFKTGNPQASKNKKFSDMYFCKIPREKLSLKDGHTKFAKKSVAYYVHFLLGQ